MATRRKTLTTRGLASIKPGEWISGDGRRGAGRLLARGLADGTIAFYFRYTGPDGRRDTLPLGTYDPAGRRGLTLQQAADRAGDLSRRYQAGERDLRGALDAEQRESERQRQADEEQAAEKALREQASLGALLTAYCEQLQRDGKVSADKVAAAIRLHVEDAWPDLWAAPAADVTTDHLLSVVGKIADAGKLREAAKLRSYLTAAYSAAIRARQSATALPALRELRITSNPARDLIPIDGATNARERALSVSELRSYWNRIAALPDPDGALLRFHLLSGAQRVDQLARVTTTDIDHDEGVVTLYDQKGRRRRPRPHVVPMIDDAREALRAMRGGELGEYAFTANAGLSGAAYHILQHRLRKVADAMVDAGETGTPFTAGDLRRTVETRLAAAGISKDTRAHLQSHGLGGVQDRHYDRYDRLSEKRAALETLHRLLTTAPAKVTPITKALARKSPG